MRAFDLQLIHITLAAEAILILLILVHLAYFFKKYRDLSVSIILLIGIIVGFFVQFSDWNQTTLAPGIKRLALLIFYLTFASLPYFIYSIKKLLRPKNVKILLSRKGPLEEILVTCEALSQEKIEATLIILRSDKLERYKSQGLSIDSKVKRELLISLFAPGTPTHKGAVLIEGERIAICSITLPVNEAHQINTATDKQLSAALNLSDHTDALVVCVAEGTGIISIASNGKLMHDVSIKKFKKQIKSLVL